MYICVTKLKHENRNPFNTIKQEEKLQSISTVEKSYRRKLSTNVWLYKERVGKG